MCVIDMRRNSAILFRYFIFLINLELNIEGIYVEFK